MAMRFVLYDTWLGRLLVAGSERGICAVALGDDDIDLLTELRTDFPDAEPAGPAEAGGAGAMLARWAQTIVEHLEGGPTEIDVPLDARGTVFQRQVWWALRAIPFGFTRTYGEIAKGLGPHTSARAVARACAGNRLAIVIPCHRAVGQDGDLTGFRWGLHRKRLLLERERQRSGGPVQLVLGMG